MVHGLAHLIKSGEGHRVHVGPTGIMVLGNVWSEQRAHAKRDRGRFMPDLDMVLQDFKAILSHDEAITAAGCYMVILDARGPICEQPAFDPALLDHVGSHPAMLEQLLANHEFIVDIGQQLAAQWPRQLVEGVDIGVDF